jgi:hypothetical protein
MNKLFVRTLSALALATSLTACAADEDMSEADKEALIREGEAEYTRVTARNVDESASLAAAAANPAVVPLVVEVYQHSNFTGNRRNIVFDEPRFANSVGCQRGLNFENVVTSVMVRKGPDYATFKAAHGEPYAVLYEHPSFQGRRLILTVGGYSNLVDESFENLTSSLKFTTVGIDVRDPDVTNPTPMAPLTAIIEAHTAAVEDRCQVQDYVLTIVRTSGDIKRDFGNTFNDTLSWVEIIPARGFNPDSVITVFEHNEFTGHHDGWRFNDRFTHLENLGLEDDVSSFRRDF